MAEIRLMRKTALREGVELSPEPEQASASQPVEGVGRYCAYNLTRERFVSNDVEGADYSAVVLASRLANITSRSEAALWLIPYRRLSPTSVRTPIDLITLNKSQVVLEIVESYPISFEPRSGPRAASALVLPANTIASAGIRVGDQLIVGTREELKEYLLGPETRKPQTPVAVLPAPGQNQYAESDSKTTDSEIRALGDRLYWADLETATESTEKSAPQEAVEAQEESDLEEPHRAALAEKAGWNRPKSMKKWWQRLKGPKDPRKAPREPLPGLIAYFFTGGHPEPHGIGNISSTGIYVLTEERWYIGTVIRITLTDQKTQTAERSLTLNAKVMRWGNDGVGLHFMYKRTKEQTTPRNPDLSGGTTRKQLEQFLALYRGDDTAN